MHDLKLSNPKDDIGVTRLAMSLIPSSALAHLALAFLEGALKYGRYNWRIAGVRSSIYSDAIDRHKAKWWNGEDSDPKTRIKHLASLMASCAILIDAELCGKLTDDRPPVAPVAELIDELVENVAHLKELFKDHHPHQYTIADSEPVERSFEDLWRECAEGMAEEDRVDEERNRGLLEYPETVYGTLGVDTRWHPPAAYYPPRPSLLRRAWDWLVGCMACPTACSCWICAAENQDDRGMRVIEEELKEKEANPFEGTTFSCSSPFECDQCEDDLYRCACEEDDNPTKTVTYSATPAPGVTLGPFSTPEALDAAVARYHQARLALDNPKYVYPSGHDAGLD